MTSMMNSAASVVLRMAGAADAGAVRQLAELDGAPPLSGAIMVALVDGEAVAALSLTDDRVVADPFRLTQDAVGLLRLRAAHLTGQVAERRRKRFWQLVAPARG